MNKSKLEQALLAFRLKTWSIRCERPRTTCCGWAHLSVDRNPL